MSVEPVPQGGKIASMKTVDTLPYLMQMISYTLFNPQDANCIGEIKK